MTNFKRQPLKSFLLTASILAGSLVAWMPTPAAAQEIGVSVQFEPPALPVYEQPPMPESGYMWTPGYWSYSDAAGGYYWVPGTWVLPPDVGDLWTPPYWGWVDGAYIFHEGYWGPHIGYYGGVNYGFGYGGSGYQGGRWEGGGFVYNSRVNNFGSVHIDHTYEQKVRIENRSNVSFAGGPHGLKSTPSAEERQAEHDHHIPVTSEQTRHISASAANPAFAASHNGGHPAIAATPRPAQFEGPGVVGARPAGAGKHANEQPMAPAQRQARPPVERAAPVEHAAPAQRPAPPPVEHAAPAQRAAPPPAQHAAPPQRQAPPPPAQRPAPPPPQQHAPPPPQQHAAPPPHQEAPPHQQPAQKDKEEKPEH
jgi:hypothetical protein